MSGRGGSNVPSRFSGAKILIFSDNGHHILIKNDTFHGQKPTKSVEFSSKGGKIAQETLSLCPKC
jgi:hypothetical protein